MRQTEVNLKITLDEENLPEKISWDATDKPGVAEEVRAFSLALWDHNHKDIMKLDLWTKDMEVPDMKNFVIQMMGSIGDLLLNSTQDEEMAHAVHQLTERMANKFREEERAAAAGF
ncbi:MAG: gliding motility protein GldC [Bacteroidota bacterium]